MSIHWLEPAPRKSIAESAFCFGCVLAGLAGAAVALQWLIGLVA